MAKGAEAFLLYAMGGEAVVLDFTGARGPFTLPACTRETGVLQKAGSPFAGGGPVTMGPPVAGSGRPWVAFLEK